MLRRAPRGVELEMDPKQLPRPFAEKYLLLRRINEGGMGTLFEALNRHTQGRCVVKVLKPELGANETLKTRFLREARAAAALASDHIVKVFDSGIDRESGDIYLVMEYLEGEDLASTKTRLGPLDSTAALKIVLQAAMGLAKAHDHGIVHRDIKPANLYLTTNDASEIVVKIVDFGVAKFRADRLHEVVEITQQDALLGTPLYMSPEQCKSADKVDARTDVWSLGVVLFELLTGRLPYRAPKGLGLLMANIMTDELPRVQDLAPWIPLEVARIVHRAVCRDTEQRFGTAAELRDALLGVVPDGARLAIEALTSVRGDERNRVMPRLDVTATTDAAETGPLEQVRGKVPTPVLVGIVAGAAALGAIAAAAQLPESTPAPTKAPLVSPPAPSSSGPARPVSATADPSPDRDRAPAVASARPSSSAPRGKPTVLGPARAPSPQPSAEAPATDFGTGGFEGLRIDLRDFDAGIPHAPPRSRAKSLSQ